MTNLSVPLTGHTPAVCATEFALLRPSPSLESGRPMLRLLPSASEVDDLERKSPLRRFESRLDRRPDGGRSPATASPGIPGTTGTANVVSFLDRSVGDTGMEPTRYELENRPVVLALDEALGLRRLDEAAGLPTLGLDSL